MAEGDQGGGGGLRYPWVRDELLSELRELAVDDPRRVWKQARAEGRTAGIDDVFHFFFDDHEFGPHDIGIVLWNPDEVAVVSEVKLALESLLTALGDRGDDAFVTHPDWVLVTKAARRALRRLEGGPKALV